MSTLALRRFAGARSKKRKAKARPRGRAVSTEYNLLLTATLCLLALGAVMVFSASSTTQVLHNGGLANSTYYLKRTLIVGAIGLVLMHVVARHGLATIRNATPALLAVSLFLLVAVLGAGSEVNGATRWLGGGSLQIQPSELAKVALILYGADMLSRKPKRARSLDGFAPYLLVTAGACGLIMLEPDMGTTMVIVFATAATLIAAGARPRDLGKIALAIGAAALLMTLVEPYRMARLTGFLNPGSEAEGAGFQAAQAKIALGSGGIEGVGIGNGVQKPRLEQIAAERGLTNVRFLPPQPREHLSQSLSAADVHYVSMHARVADCLMPSKLYGILASGSPVIAACPLHSELAEIVEDCGVGLVCDAGSKREPVDTNRLAEDLARSICRLVERPAEAQRMGCMARQVAEEKFDRRLQTDMYAQLLEDVLNDVSETVSMPVERDAAELLEPHEPRRRKDPSCSDPFLPVPG